jgi:hypothetical protein
MNGDIEDRRYARFNRRRQMNTLLGVMAFLFLLGLVLLLMFKFVFR